MRRLFFRFRDERIGIHAAREIQFAEEVVIGGGNSAEVRVGTQILNVGFRDRMFTAQDFQQRRFLKYRPIDELIERRGLIPALRETHTRGARERKGRREYGGKTYSKTASHKIKASGEFENDVDGASHVDGVSVSRGGTK